MATKSTDASMPFLNVGKEQTEVMLRMQKELLDAYEQAWRLVEWAKLSGSNAPAPPTAPAEQPDAPAQATDSPPAAPAGQPDVPAQPTDSPPAASVPED